MPMSGLGMPMSGLGMPMIGLGMPMIGLGMPMIGIGFRHTKLPLRTCTICSRSFDSYAMLGMIGHLSTTHGMMNEKNKERFFKVNDKAMTELQSKLLEFFPNYK